MKTNKQLFGNLTQAWHRQAKILLGIIALIAVIVCTMLACNDGSKDDNSATVYLAGEYYDAATGTRTPCYWKNGARTDLSLPAGAGFDRGFSGIAVSPNGDVYVSGWYGIGDHDDPDYTSCYWKNGVRTDASSLSVPAGAEVGSLRDIAVSANGDVYVLGEYETEDDDISCYWKNGVRTDLSSLSVPAGAEAYISEDGGLDVGPNGDVYVLGGYRIPDGVDEDGYSDYTYTPCYWKNNVRTDLNLSVPAGAEADPYNMAVSPKGDVCILGIWWNDTTDTYGYCYWKNGVRTDLSLPAGAEFGGYVYDIAISPNGDVYVLGAWYIDDDYVISYWKNGVRTDVGGGNNSYPQVIAVR